MQHPATQNFGSARAHTCARTHIRARGIVLILVMIAVAIASTLGAGFLASQSTATHIGENIDHLSKARFIAESGLEIVQEHVRISTQWRTDEAHGQAWVTNQSFAGGTFTVYGEDGQDLDDDGTIGTSGTEGDGDLSDDSSDVLTLTSVGTFEGVTHTATAVLTTGPQQQGPKLLLIVGESPKHWQDVAKIAQFEAWGYTVTTVVDTDSTSTYADAMTDVDVIYISERVFSGDVDLSVFSTTAGLVVEELGNYDSMKASTSNGQGFHGTTIDITNNTHEITSVFSLGSLQVYSSNAGLTNIKGSIGNGQAPGLTALADQGGSGTQTSFAVLDVGDTLVDNSAAPGRRVVLPYGDNNANYNQMTEDGLTLIERALAWAAVDPLAEDENTPQIVALYTFDEPDPVAPVLIGHWKLDDANNGDGAGGGGLHVGQKITMYNATNIDSYDSSLGDYGGANITSKAIVTTNITSNKKVTINGGKIKGDFYAGVGADPDAVIQSYNGGSVTGTKGSLSASVDVSKPSAPSGMPSSSGSKTDNGSTRTIGSDGVSTDVVYNSWTLNNNSVITIRGDVRIQATGAIKLNRGSINLAPGATLEIYCGGNLTLNNNSYINNDSSRAGDCAVYLYGNNKTCRLNSSTIISGTVHVSGKVTLNSSSTIYGRVIGGKDLTINAGPGIHLDTALPGLYGGGGGGGGGVSSPSLVVDEIATSHGSYENGAVTTDSAYNGRAAVFDGVDDYVDIPHDSSYLLDDGSVSFWFYAEDTSGLQGLVGKDSNGFDDGGHLSIYLDGSKLYYRLQSNSAHNATSRSNVTPDAWHHVVATWGADGMRLYVDGALADSDSYSGGTGTTSGGTGNAEPWIFGASAIHSGNQTNSDARDFLEGRIDDVRVYDQNLSADQAANLYGGSDPGKVVPPYVLDVSGVGTAVDLVITDPSDVSWISGGGIEITGDGSGIVSPEAATKIIDTLVGSGEYTVEIIVTPASISSSAYRSLFELGTTSNSNDIDIDQTQTDVPVSSRIGGYEEMIEGSDVIGLAETSVIVSYDGEELKAYVDGVLVDSKEVTGSLNGFSSSSQMSFGSEVDGDQLFLGKIHRVAIYDKGVTASQATQISNGLAPTLDSEDEGVFSARWIE